MKANRFFGITLLNSKPLLKRQRLRNLCYHSPFHLVDTVRRQITISRGLRGNYMSASISDTDLLRSGTLPLVHMAFGLASDIENMRTSSHRYSIIDTLARWHESLPSVYVYSISPQLHHLWRNSRDLHWPLRRSATLAKRAAPRTSITDGADSHALSINF